jgi:hypothetical protein
VERALCGGLHGGLYCLWNVIEIELLHIGLGIDCLNTCKENELNVEILSVFQLFIIVTRYYTKCRGISPLSWAYIILPNNVLYKFIPNVDKIIRNIRCGLGLNRSRWITCSVFVI